jgi:hypothetical protein
MSVTASPVRATADSAAATNERPTGYRRNSEVWDKNTRRDGSSLDITHSIPALTQRENTNFARGSVALPRRHLEELAETWKAAGTPYLRARIEASTTAVPRSVTWAIWPR